MHKVVIGIFAHPDDEAFGPSGTLLKMRDTGYEIHLILLTDGDAGMNIDEVPDLAATRLQEWQKSAILLGARSTHALHFPDGTLETIPEEEIDLQVTQVITDILKDYDEPSELSFITFEPRGLTGHHDHVAASQLTRRMSTNFTTRAVWYYCLDSTQAPLDGTAYYVPRAREDSYITNKVDVSQWLQQKLRVIDAHVSQRHDAETMKKLGPRTECFHIERL